MGERRPAASKQAADASSRLRSALLLAREPPDGVARAALYWRTCTDGFDSDWRVSPDVRLDRALQALRAQTTRRLEASRPTTSDSIVRS